MSLHCLQSAFNAPLGDPTAKAVLVVLGNFADEDGVAWGSIATICRFTDLSPRTVQSALRRLEAEGILETKLQGGKGLSNSYTLHIPTPAADAGVNIRPPQQLHPTPAGDAGGPPQQLHPTPAAAAPIKKGKVLERKGEGTHTPISTSFIPEIPSEYSEKKRAALEQWIGHKTDQKFRYTARGWAALLATKIVPFSDSAVVASIAEAIERGWQGFFPDRHQPAASILAPEKKAAPENWKSIALTLYPGASVPRNFDELPAEVRHEIRDYAAKPSQPSLFRVVS